MDLQMLLQLLGGQGGEEDHKNVKQITADADFQKELDDAGDKIVAVDFFAVWCMPCKIIGPVFSDLSLKYTDVVFLRVDVDQLQETAQQCGIRAMPTFQFFHKGHKVNEFSGADPAMLEKTLKDIGAKPDPDYEKRKLEEQETAFKAKKKTKTDEDHGNVVMLESRAQMQDILADKKLVVAKFSADWCGPCRMMMPYIVQLSKEMTDVTFVEVDTEAPGLDNVCDECRVRALPTFCVFKDGVKMEEVVGANKPALKKAIEKQRK